MGKPAVLDYRLTRWQRAWLSTEPARQLLLQSSAHSLSLLGVRAHLVALQSVWQHLQALLLLAAWCACVQAVLGLQVFGGLLRRRCALCADDACTAPQPGSELWSQLPCGRGRACPAPFTCLAVDVEPLATWASYDSMSWASLSVFRLWTRGGWSLLLHTTAAAVGHARAVSFCLPGVLVSQMVFQPLLVAVLADAVGTAWRQLAGDAHNAQPVAHLLASLAAASVAVRRWLGWDDVHGNGDGASVDDAASQDGDGHKASADPLSGAETRSSSHAWRAGVLQLCDSSPMRVLLGATHLANAAAMCVVPPTAGASGTNIAATAVFAAYTAARLAAFPWRVERLTWSEGLDAGVTLAAVVALIPWNGVSHRGVITLRLVCALYRTAAAELDHASLAWLAALLHRRPLLHRLRVAVLQAFAAARTCGSLALLFCIVFGLIGRACFAAATYAAGDATASYDAVTFSTVPAALLTAARLLTGANDWDAVAFDAMQHTGNATAVLFFLVAQLAGGILLLTLCTAYVVRGFSRDGDLGANSRHGGSTGPAVTTEADQAVGRELAARALAAHVNPITAALEARLAMVKRHAAARVVEAMRNQLASAGHIQGRMGRVFDWGSAGPDAKGGTSEAGVTHRSGGPLVAWKDRRRAFKMWIQAVTVVAPDGQTFMDDGCDGYSPGHALCDVPDEHWQGVDPFTLLRDGMPLPATLAAARDVRQGRGVQLGGRLHFLRSRRVVNARLLDATEAHSGAAFHPSDTGDGGSVADDAATRVSAAPPSGMRPGPRLGDSTDSELSDTEDPHAPDPHDLGRPPSAATVPSVNDKPLWLDREHTLAAAAQHSSGSLKQPSLRRRHGTRSAQARARDAVLAVQSRPALIDAEAHKKDSRSGCPALVDGATLWAPLPDDMALPFLYGDAVRVRQAASVPPQPGEVSQCLTFGTEHLPLRFGGTWDALPEEVPPSVLYGSPDNDIAAHHVALWLFGPMHPLRRTLFLLLRDPAVQAARIVGTVAALVLLAVENPRLDPRGVDADRIKHADMAINMLFLLEMAANLVVYGGVGHPGAFFRRGPAAWADLAALVGGFVGAMSTPKQLRVLRCLRMFSLLRPLRRLPWCRPLTLCLAALEAAAPALRTLLLAGLWVWFAFSVTAAQLAAPLADDLCSDPAVAGGAITRCRGSFVAPSTGVPGARLEMMPVLNFNTVPDAALALFAMSTLDGWAAVAMPLGAFQPGVIALLLVWMIVFGVVWRALVMGAVVDAYLYLSHRLVDGRRDGENAGIRRAWAVARRLKRQQTARMSAVQTRRDNERAASKGGRWAQLRLVVSARVDTLGADAAVLACVLVTTILSAQWRPETGLSSMQRAQESLFTALLVSERLAVLVARGPRAFFRSPRQLFDLAVVVAALARIGLGPSAVPFNPLVLLLLRLDRWLRLATTQLRILHILSETVTGALPGIAAAMTLWSALLMVHTLFGMALFGTRLPPPPLSGASPAGRVPADFASFGRAALSVMRAATTDGWTDMVAQLMACDDESRALGAAGPLFGTTCHARVAPPLFFISISLTMQLGCALLVAACAAAYEAACDEAGVGTNIGDSLKRYELLRRAVTRFKAPVTSMRVAHEARLDKIDAAALHVDGGGAVSAPVREAHVP